MSGWRCSGACRTGARRNSVAKKNATDQPWRFHILELRRLGHFVRCFSSGLKHANTFGDYAAVTLRFHIAYRGPWLHAVEAVVFDFGMVEERV